MSNDDLGYQRRRAEHGREFARRATPPEVEAALVRPARSYLDRFASAEAGGVEHA